MQKFKVILVYVFSILFFGKQFPQSFNFRNYNTEHGLPQSQVLCMYQDNNGYIWFGTNSGGAGKFDGIRFTTFTGNEGLVNNVVFSITGNDKGDLFFGTAKGLSVYSGGKFKNFDEKNGLKNSSIYKLMLYSGKLWIGTEVGVFTYSENKIEEFAGDTILSKSSVYTMLTDKDNNLWFGTLQNGVIFYDTKNKTFKHFSESNGLLSNFIFSLSQMDNGTVLAGTRFGLNKIDGNFKITAASEIHSNNNLSYICVEKAGGNTFYFGTSSEGLLEFDFDKSYRYFYHGYNGMGSYAVLSLLKDREGNLWAGTDGGGVYKFRDKKFTYFTKLNGLHDKYITAVAKDRQGATWVAIAAKGLAKIKGAAITPYRHKNGDKTTLHDEGINTILSASDGKMFFGTDLGLSVMENEKFRLVEDTLIAEKYILTLYEDKNGNVWIGTTTGVFQYNKGVVSSVKAINSLKKPGFDFGIYSITNDRYGNLWMGTENGAILYDGKTVKRFNDEKQFVNSRVGTCISDKKGNIWFGTEKGLFLYNNNSFVKIGADYGIVPAFVNFLQIDQSNHLIIGTNNGLDIINLNDFYRNIKQSRHLGKEDGLLSLESNSNASALDPETGKVLIGTVDGLEMYDPQLDIPNPTEPFIHITNVKLFFGNEDILSYADHLDSLSMLPASVVLPYTKNNLTFQFVGISMAIPEKVMYQYKLIGIDEDWTPPVSKTEVTYPSLPPGSYTFAVKSMNDDGVWNENPATFTFTILSPWYKTWWFYSLCALFLIVGIISYNTYKTKKLVADKQKLEATVNERTRELREEKEKVEEQKQEIEHKNTEITDSIKYAKNIQEALLPSLEETEKAFNDCFVLYLPKDIVSGDFFWFHNNGTTKYIAAADCTGHGVPGAFMSIVGNTLLNEIVEQKKIEVPGDILLELHNGVKEALSHNEKEGERRDGMDIALCALSNNSSEIHYSGANRPLWIYRKNKGYTLEIIKPSKFPIGGIELEENRRYANHSIQVEKGDKLYIFSDGFADQFGGPRGKKLMVTNMQRLIFESINEPANAQKEKIKAAFDNWKQNMEQVDDVLVIGITI